MSFSKRFSDRQSVSVFGSVQLLHGSGVDLFSSDLMDLKQGKPMLSMFLVIYFLGHYYFHPHRNRVVSTAGG